MKIYINSNGILNIEKTNATYELPIGSGIAVYSPDNLRFSLKSSSSSNDYYLTNELITTLQKESGDFYTDRSELETALKDFFFKISPSTAEKFGYDATVGTGGTYATFSEAIATETKTTIRLVAISNVTEIADITIPENKHVFIDLKGFTLDMTTYNFTIEIDESLEITGNYNNLSPYTNRAKIVFSYSIAKSLFNAINDNIKVYNVYITNNSTVINANITGRWGVYYNIKAKLPNSEGCGFSNFTGILKDSEIEGGGIDCYNIITNATANTSYIENLKLKGNFSNSNYVINCYGGIFNYIEYLSNSDVKFGVGNMTNLIDEAGKVSVDVIDNGKRATISKSTCKAIIGRGEANVLSCTFKSDVSVSAIRNNMKFMQCEFLGNLSIAGDNHKFNQISVSGTVTNSGTYTKISQLDCDTFVNSVSADYLDISQSTYLTSKTDSGTNTQNWTGLYQKV